jgi:hypothetical protein
LGTSRARGRGGLGDDAEEALQGQRLGGVQPPHVRLCPHDHDVRWACLLSLPFWHHQDLFQTCPGRQRASPREVMRVSLTLIPSRTAFSTRTVDLCRGGGARWDGCDFPLQIAHPVKPNGRLELITTLTKARSWTSSRQPPPPYCAQSEWCAAFV